MDTLPHLLQSKHAHILALSPPLDLRPEWFGPHVAYSMSKFGMSQVMLGLSQEHRGRVAANALWPRTTIATAAVEMLGGEALMRTSRRPEIIADAAAWILSQPVDVTGRFFIDDEVMAEMGITDLSGYAVDPNARLSTDLFVDPQS